jgi:hypothetical protein
MYKTEKTKSHIKNEELVVYLIYISPYDLFRLWRESRT